eukprot:GILI01001952.1.p2 GENE.GILI01001952.1~~GILI01001952.1.p2  ORF type:complete len:666 (-),score=236.66 GILI01001952.1:73-2070(-)
MAETTARAVEKNTSKAAKAVNPNPLTHWSSEQASRVGHILDDHEHDLRSRIKEILKEDLYKPRFDIPMDEQRELNLKRLLRLTRPDTDIVNGLYGDKNQTTGLRKINPSVLIATQETLSMCDFGLSVKYGVQFGLFGCSILNLGTERHHHKYLNHVQSLELPGCYALTELTHGSNARAIETEAIYDHATKELIIRTPTDAAQKYWIGNAAKHGKMAVVFAQLIVKGKNHGVHAVMAPIRNPDGTPYPGVRIADCGYKMGLNTVDNGRIWFDDIRVPVDNLLDRYGTITPEGEYSSPIKSQTVRFNSMLGSLVGGRITVGSCALQMCKVGLTIATRYALSRRQFGPPNKPEVPILDFLTHQRRLFPAIAATYALQIGINYAKHRYLTKTERDEREVFLLGCGFKAACTWAKVQVLQDCRECCGGFGFGADAKIGLLRQDSDVDVTYEGDNTVLLQAVSKALLDELKGRLSGQQGVTNLLSYLTKQMGVWVVNANVVTKRLTFKNHLRSPEFMYDAMVYREFKLLRLLVKRMKEKQREKKDSFDAWNDNLDLVLALGRAYVERVAVEKFIEKINSVDADLRPLLQHLCCLYALSRIEADLSWYLGFGYFAPNKAKAIQMEVNDLCNELRPFALDAVNGFGVPEHLLGPIAFDWEQIYSWKNVQKSKL